MFIVMVLFSFLICILDLVSIMIVLIKHTNVPSFKYTIISMSKNKLKYVRKTHLYMKIKTKGILNMFIQFLTLNFEFITPFAEEHLHCKF